MSDRPSRSRRQPPRADEVISFAPLPRTTGESSPPPEPVATATATTFGVPLHNLRTERLWTEELSNAGEPIAVELSTNSESGDSTDPSELDDEVPRLDTPEDSSEDEGRDGAVPADEDRAAQITLVSSPIRVLPLATRARAPAVQETEEGTPVCSSLTRSN